MNDLFGVGYRFPHADFLMNMCQGEGGREILLT